jgi:putative membrane protein
MNARLTASEQSGAPPQRVAGAEALRSPGRRRGHLIVPPGLRGLSPGHPGLIHDAKHGRLLPYAGTLLLAAAFAPAAFAHGGEVHGPARPHDWAELWRTWGLEPGVLVPLALSGYLYARGLARMWRAAGIGHGIRTWEAASFAGGWLALFVALVSPLHPWGSVLFSAHMTQHEILMLVAAPLLVLGKPLVASLKALPPGWAQALARATGVGWWQAVWHTITNPFVAWIIHAVVLWAWHVPALFQATIDDEFVHALQHLSFLLSALLFWWAVMEGPQRAAGFGVAVLYLFTTALHSGLLGALITLTSTVWYPAYRETAPWWGLTALEDQQLGGLIMWVPACLTYIAAGLALFAAWLRTSEERVRRWETELAPARTGGAVP